MSRKCILPFPLRLAYFDDMSEFHGYALRKHTMRCYTSVLAWQDNLTSHPFFQRACRGVLTIYLHLLDCPEDTDGLGHLTTVSFVISPPPLLSVFVSFFHCCCDTVVTLLCHTVIHRLNERKSVHASRNYGKKRRRSPSPAPLHPYPIPLPSLPYTQ